MGKLRRIESFVDYCYKKDYFERPVPTWDILSSPLFFGKLTGDGKLVFPVWKEKLPEIMSEDSKYLAVLTGAIGIGKSWAAAVGIGCGMQRVLCLRNPHGYFNLAAGSRISIVFFNLTKTLSKGKAFRILQTHLLASSWFRERGIVKGEEGNQWLDIPLFEYVLASPYSKGFGTVGGDVLFAVMDEVDSPTESIKQKERVLQAYESTVRRFKSRFVDPIYKETLGKFFLVASKQEELSFLNTFVAEHKDTNDMVIVDVPFWFKLPKNSLSGKKFLVGVGNDYVPSRIIMSLDDKNLAVNQGLQVQEVPIEFYKDFETDVVGAIRDIAGISIGSLRRSKLFTSEKVLRDCYDSTKQDPMSKTTIPISLGDDIELIKFVDFSKIRMPKSVRRFIHCDIAYSGDGDALSLAMSGIKGWTTVNVMKQEGTFETRSMPVVETDFAFRLKGRPGGQIPLFKMRKFILDLRTVGFEIGKYTADLALLSEDSKQILTTAGIECDYLSLDKDTKAYLTFMGMALEKRWIFHYNALAHFELVNLEKDDKTGKIDHPNKVVNIALLDDGGTKEEVLKGSKDLADGIAGSVYSAILDSGSMPLTEEDVTPILQAMRRAREIDSPEKSMVDRMLLNKQVVEPEKVNVLSKDSSSVDHFAELLRHVEGHH